MEMHGRKLVTEHDESSRRVVGRACQVNVFRVGADEHPQVLLADTVQDGLDAEAEKDGAERVALLLA